MILRPGHRAPSPRQLERHLTTHILLVLKFQLAQFLPSQHPWRLPTLNPLLHQADLTRPQPVLVKMTPDDRRAFNMYDEINRTFAFYMILIFWAMIALAASNLVLAWLKWMVLQETRELRVREGLAKLDRVMVGGREVDKSD